MHRHSLFAPVTTLIIGLIIIVVLFGTPYGQSGATVSFAYTSAQETATASAYVSPADRAATNTAQAKQTASPSTATTAPTIAATVDAAATPTITATRATAAATVTIAAVPTITAFPTIAATAAPPTATPIAALQCNPGVPLTVSGEGPAGSGVLLLFADRIVSGAVVRPNGTWSMQLVVGDEEPGVYPIVVQTRGTMEQLLSTTCLVPAITPTPPPLGRGP